MSWTPLCDRIDRLPLILAGPILRRTEPNAVTVWVALKAPCNVTLKVYSTVRGNGEIIDRLLLLGKHYTIPLGQFLHVVAVTAKPLIAEESQLQPGEIYAYDLEFGNNNLVEAVNFESGFPEVIISYFSHQLPTFAMPPDDLNYLRIVHGSCRKPHGGGRDALTILDDLIYQSANQPLNRPQQLFLTGDQIYGDDVADPLLWAVTDAGNTLLGWEEKLPLQHLENDEIEYIKISDLLPGKRSDIARDYGGFTAMFVNKPKKAKSHLFGLGEYFAMYLFAWSPIVWPNRFPTGERVRKDRKNAKLWDEEAAVVLEFANDIWKVRRSLANISTYMICDDHDVTDDWFLNREWCDRVLSKPLGKRAVQNAMLAYAIFQAWGNTPEQFRSEQPGEKLLIAAKDWSMSGGKNNIAWENVAKYLGIPVDTSLNSRYQEDENTLILNRQYSDETQSLIWYYSIRSFKHEVIVLDTRTWRGYIKGENKTTEPPMLLSPTAFKQQIQQPLKETNNSQIEATFVVIPTNLVSLSFVDSFQNWDWERHQVDNMDRIFNSDVGDSWNFNKVGFGNLLTYLLEQRDRVIILTGDIHYSGAVILNYCARSLDKTFPKILAQLTASAFKNEEFTTKLVHTKVSSLALQQPEVWAGWNQQPKLFEVQRIQELIQVFQLENSSEIPLLREIKSGSWQNHDVSWAIAVDNPKSLPDWWYRTEWIERQKSQPAAWEKAKNSASDSQKKSSNLASWLWQRWLQEGKEVVGLANIGLVSFNWSTENDDAKAVIQDIYWRSSWDNQSIVYSRYFVSLKLKTLPLPVHVIPLHRSPTS
ncbi:PhoD-like phosphatase [Floridanema evergladense]|uniref:PhoD-like phosphatase n=1 Tax=Floridaenema evergladense BLCC-F167 TaxID=3153639 RepID=A0ABV4WMU7_9CYAN